LESGETDTEVIQKTLDEAVCGVNDLQDAFYENDSEIETVARDCIGVTVAYILKWFGIPIDTPFPAGDKAAPPACLKKAAGSLSLSRAIP